MIIRKKNTDIKQSAGEEIANSIIHGVGFILSIFGLIILVYNSILAGTVWHIVSCSLYGATLLTLFLTSTLYHSISHKEAKKIFRRLDHISIFLLIAGTYMPITLVALRGVPGWIIFSLQCTFCLVGIFFKAYYGPRYPKVSLAIYLLMGWIAIFTLKPILIALSIKGLIWVLCGGFFYTLGVVFFVADGKYRFFHAIWHIFVLLGSASHFVMVLFYVIPLPIL